MILTAVDPLDTAAADTVLAVHVDSIAVPVAIGVDLPVAETVEIADTMDFQPASDTLDFRPAVVDDPRVTRLLAEADSLRCGYEFTKALGMCRQAMEYTSDSLRILEIEDSQILCENGANMLEFAYIPAVVDRKRFSINDFYLYYPLKDKGWHNVSGEIPGYEGIPQAVYAPGDSAKVTVNDMEKVYSVVSEDGKAMYFSSASLYGMGGYDIYVSYWDEKASEWGAPVNMGIPFSSPYDDFLYVDTADGKYTLFASNRGCPADSINVYVLEYDSMPIRTAVVDVAQVRKLMELEPHEEATGPQEDNVEDALPENAETERYTGKMAEVRALRDSIYIYDKALDEERSRFALSDDVDERARLTTEILRRESELPRLNEALDRAAAELQKIEMEFLFSGIAIDPEKVNVAMNQKSEVKELPSGFSFVRMSPGDTIAALPAVTEEEFDYTFMILPEGRFAPDSTLPEGVVYQIQVFNVGRKATVSQLKGLSPVFERATASGRYNYAAGVFRTYSEATDALARVKRLGFRNAYIVAYTNGTPIAVSKARELQK
ncbi:MAG: hypothetical protein NC308_00140 [Clostridium sp.]|nr:hypothetical protein [Bacteroides sp.]MCM1197275.1 hypothetical protein [Clostridium sp.]